MKQYTVHSIFMGFVVPLGAHGCIDTRMAAELMRHEVNLRRTYPFQNGGFELAAVNEERMLFNCKDLRPDRSLLPYVMNCELTTAPQMISFVPYVGPEFVDDGLDEVSLLLNEIQARLIGYRETNVVNEEPEGDGVEKGPGAFFVRSAGCIDCREFGSNIKPDFG